MAVPPSRMDAGRWPVRAHFDGGWHFDDLYVPRRTWGRRRRGGDSPPPNSGGGVDGHADWLWSGGGAAIKLASDVLAFTRFGAGQSENGIRRCGDLAVIRETHRAVRDVFAVHARAMRRRIIPVAVLSTPLRGRCTAGRSLTGDPMAKSYPLAQAGFDTRVTQRPVHHAA